MTNLKTLKDICIGCECCKGTRQEAIKWLKMEGQAWQVMNWISHFFNLTQQELTEEDLK